jgi:hypothetical protein
MQLFESPDGTALNFYLWGWMNSEVYKRKVDTGDELLVHMLDAATCVKRSEDQLRRTKRDLHTQAAKCIELDGGILEKLL